MAKISLRELRVLIREAIEEMGVEETFADPFGGARSGGYVSGGTSSAPAPKEKTAKDLSLSSHDKYVQMRNLLDTLMSDDLKDDPEGQAEVLAQIQKVTADATKSVMQEALRRRQKMLKNR